MDQKSRQERLNMKIFISALAALAVILLAVSMLPPAFTAFAALSWCGYSIAQGIYKYWTKEKK